MPQPNNSFNRSGISAAFIREAWMLDALNARPLNSGVGRLPSYPERCEMWNNDMLF